MSFSQPISALSNQEDVRSFERPDGRDKRLRLLELIENALGIRIGLVFKAPRASVVNRPLRSVSWHVGFATEEPQLGQLGLVEDGKSHGEFGGIGLVPADALR